MSPETIMAIGQRALEVMLLLAMPLLLVALVVGLLVGIFQAATQINEMTLSFIPKLLAMTAAPRDLRAVDAEDPGQLHARADRKHPVTDPLT
jgi:hypothetical protein